VGELLGTMARASDHVATGLTAAFVAVAIMLAGMSIPAAAQATTSAKPSTSMSKEKAEPPRPQVSTTLERTTFAELPGWERDDHLAAFKTFLKSCDWVINGAARGRISTGDTKVVPDELADACREAQKLKKPTKASAKAFFESRFAPHRIVHNNTQGLLTGYYEPILKGSRTAEGKFQTPVYKRPTDLLNVVDEADRASKQDGLSHVRKTSSGTAAFPTRQEIEEGALAGQDLELLYLEDPVECFFMHIQGSARIELTDGTTTRINYAGKNGHPYSSIGRYLIENDMLSADKMSMQALGKWLRSDLERGRRVMWQNKSFIFFREIDDAEGPVGAMAVPLTPGRSLAVDTSFHTLGTPLYVSAPNLSHATKSSGFNRLMVAQDVGSAIKGPERGDIFFGSGEKAGRIAGVTKHAGNFFVLLPATVEVAGDGIRFGEHLRWQTTVKDGH